MNQKKSVVYYGYDKRKLSKERNMQGIERGRIK